MNSTRIVPAGLAGIILAATAAAAVVMASGDAPASEAPTPSPVSTPSSSPVATPAQAPRDAMPLTVELANATGAHVWVDIVDRTGALAEAKSGTPGDGASVEPYVLDVENIDERTLRLTWVDYPVDNALALFVDRTDGGLRLVLVQPEPSGPTDAIGFDRELILTFDAPISSADVEAFLQDGLDT